MDLNELSNFPSLFWCCLHKDIYTPVWSQITWTVLSSTAASSIYLLEVIVSFTQEIKKKIVLHKTNYTRVQWQEVKSERCFIKRHKRLRTSDPIEGTEILILSQYQIPQTSLTFYNSRAETFIFDDLPRTVNERNIKLNSCPRVTPWRKSLMVFLH